MSNYDDEQRAMDLAIQDEHAGLVLQTVGGIILSFCSIISVWIFVGWRSGSFLWFWMTFGLGTVGMACVAAGALMGAKAAKDFAAAGVAIRSRAIPMPGAEKLPSWDELKKRVA